MIKAKRVQDVREILRSSEFVRWYEQYDTVSAELRAVRLADPDILTHTILRAGEYEDLTHQAEATYASLDGSFETLSAFEQQRTITSGAWEALTSLEYRLANARQDASDLRTRLSAMKKESNANADALHIESELKVKEREVSDLAQKVAQGQEWFERETKLRDEMWKIVENAWSTTFRANMARIEYGFLGRRLRAAQERLAGGGQSDRTEDSMVAETEQARLEGELAELLRQAEEMYDCVAIAEFMYWPHQDDMRAALCVPLVGDMEFLNIQVNRLLVYKVERAKGLNFIEPLPQTSEDADAEADGVRLEGFFSGRPT